MTPVRALKKTPPASTPATVMPLADVTITWTLDPDGKSRTRAITGVELAPILEWLHDECNGIWPNLLGERGDIPDRLMRLTDLLATYSTAEQKNDDGGDVYELAETMRSLVRRVMVRAPAHASVTITNRGEVAL
jgi:hypothetical protein